MGLEIELQSSTSSYSCYSVNTGPTWESMWVPLSSHGESSLNTGRGTLLRVALEVVLSSIRPLEESDNPETMLSQQALTNAGPPLESLKAGLSVRELDYVTTSGER